MKLGPRLLIEIMGLVQTGLVEQRDISEMLRSVDVITDPDNSEIVELSSYINLKTGGY